MNPADYRVIDMYQGNKRSRILAWTYQNIHERSEWQWKKQMLGGEE
jgi:23S rRNA A1618 N6-methylase RlmF